MWELRFFSRKSSQTSHISVTEYVACLEALKWRVDCKLTHNHASRGLFDPNLKYHITDWTIQHLLSDIIIMRKSFIKLSIYDPFVLSHSHYPLQTSKIPSVKINSYLCSFISRQDYRQNCNPISLQWPTNIGLPLTGINLWSN